MDLRSMPPHLLARAAAMPENRHAQMALERAAGLRGHKDTAGGEKASQRGSSAAGRVEKRGGGLSSLRLTLYGAPRTKKNHGSRMKIGGQVKTIPSAAWMRWRDECLRQVAHHPWMRLRDHPYNVAADFYRDADRGDATGYYQGLADVLEEAGIVSNDRLLATWDGSRLLVDREHPRVEITLTPAD